jgi:beta-glucosidase
MSGGHRGRWQPLLPDRRVAFPSDFLWGVASSAFQSEGGAGLENDWVEAARAGRVPPNAGNGFLERYAGDFALVASLGVRHYRLSVEWSRVEPERGRFDEAALDLYRRICDAAAAAGLTPWVNLFHFTHPSWLARAGGFLEPASHAAFLRYAERVARALAPRVRHWHVQNESMVYVLISYLLGVNPPYVRDGARAFAMTRPVLALHAGAFRALKSIDPGCTVATIEVYQEAHPADPGDPVLCERAERFDAWYNRTLWRALATGVVELPGREPEEIPHLRGALDAYGFNYYNAMSFGAAGVGRWSELADPPVDAMDRAVHPRGLEDGLLRVAQALPGVPLLVTENGCPTADETFRIRYLAAHLAALERARRRGADVRGYFHWTAVDNYEWLEGFAEDKRFGLVGFDPVTGERALKASGAWLRDVIARGALEPGSIP